MRNSGYAKLIRSAESNGQSIVELNILPGEKTPWHYHSLFSETFTVLKGTTTIDPGNRNFEHALFILKGLANDGLATDAGTPKKFTDLCLFVYLSNSRMVGYQQFAEPVFNFFAKAAIKKGQLNGLIQKYVNQGQKNRS